MCNVSSSGARSLSRFLPAPGVNTRQKIPWKIGTSSKKYLLKKEKLCSLRSSYSLQILKWFLVSRIHFSSIHNHSIWLKNILSYSCYLHLTFLVHVVTAGGGDVSYKCFKLCKVWSIPAALSRHCHHVPSVSSLETRSVEDENASPECRGWECECLMMISEQSQRLGSQHDNFRSIAATAPWEVKGLKQGSVIFLCR